MGEPASVLIIIGAGAVILVAVGAIAFRDGIIVRPSTRTGAALLAVFGVLLLATGVLLAFHTSADPPVATDPTHSSAPASTPAAPPPIIATTGANPPTPTAAAPPAAIGTTSTANPAPQPNPSRPCSSQQTAPVRDGRVEGMAPQEGYDLDCGVRNAPEEVPGLDISGRRTEPVIDSLATSVGGRLARLPDSGPHDRSACDALPNSAWAKNVTGIDRPGAAICVRTSEGNIAVMTLTEGWTEQQPELTFTYRIWYA